MADRTDTTYEANATHGYLAQLLMGDGTSPEQYEAVALVRSITPGRMETAVIDKTHLRSPAAHREKMPGMRDSGAFVCACIMDLSEESQSNAGGGSGAFQNGGTLAKWIDRSTHNWQIRFGSGSPQTAFPFSGFVSAWQLGEIGQDDLIPLTLEITPASDFSSNLP